MGLLDKFKKKTTYDKTKGDIDGEILMINPYIDIISNACAECYKTDNTSKDYNQRAEYISRRIATGHESILEHSNVVMLFALTELGYRDLTEFMALCHFLHVKTKHSEDKIYVLLGGSLRGYKSIIRTIENPNNIVYKSMLNQLYHLNKNIFKDLIDDEIMDEDRFKNDISSRTDESKYLIKDNITITNIDNNSELLEKISPYGFTKEDTYDMCTVTVYFSRLPRIISQQLTRHRNAITQASQRYINYSSACFISPAECKPDKYDKTKLYGIKALDSDDIFTLEQLGNEIVSIYSQLVDQGLLKEDARAYLPNNVETSLFVTFTYHNLFHFLTLRMQQSAQADIRSAADTIYDLITPVIEEDTDSMWKHLEPEYKKKHDEADYNDIDEVLV